MNLLVRKMIRFLLPIKNLIYFNSIPDMSDNTKAVFDEMLSRGMNSKYHMVWQVENRKEYRNYNVKNVKFVDKTNLWNKLLDRYFLTCAKCIISCNAYLWRMTPDQYAIFLDHGSPIKSLRGKYETPIKYITHQLVSADCFIDVISYEHNVPKEMLISLGYPRNDILKYRAADVKKILKTECKKVIVWYPTFRQRKSDMKSVTEKPLPIIHDIEAAKHINDIAKENNVLIVLKPHFAQKVDNIKDLNLSNIKFITDDFYYSNHISSYTFLSGCDALLTDYSSVYFDFTLCNRPIGVIWEDIEEYRKNEGIAIDLDYYLQGAEKIYNESELSEFIVRISKDEDILCDKRNEIKRVVNKNADKDCVGSVVDFIIKNAKL